MQESSVVSIKSTLPSVPFSLYNPDFSSTNFSFNSLNQYGWVKSAVPTKSIPFFFAQITLCSKSKSLEQALAYLECKCKSAIILIAIRFYHFEKILGNKKEVSFLANLFKCNLR